MKRLVSITLFAGITFSLQAQIALTLDSCRALAMENNKELLIGQEKIKAAHYQNKAAFTNYLPKLSATGTYIRNQKEISILNDEQKAGLSQLGTTVGTQVKGFAQQLAVAHPELAPLIASLGNFDIATPLNAAGNSIVDAFRTDTRNMYAGAITLTQPLYMGG